MDVRDQDAALFLQAILEELRTLREEAARQTALLEAMLQKIGSIERSQYG
jgi:hypothetical protein